jgi:hypothetical protein
MASLRTLGLAVVGGALGAVFVAALVGGCGDDNAGQTRDASTDQTSDVRLDLGGDTTSQDVGDAGHDVGAIESGPGRDASDASSSSDAMASCVSDAGSDGPNAVQQFATQYARAFCSGQGKCCPGYDAGGFDLASCTAAWGIIGWEYTLPANPAAYAGCHLAFNATQGAACISALQNFACNPDGGAVTASQYNAVTNACLGVLIGTIANGSGGCVSSFECADGYCDLTADGGASTGRCAALVGDGGSCTTRGLPAPLESDMCSRAGRYQPTLWCNRLDGGATGTCVPPLPNGATCYVPAISATYFNDYGCSTLLCGDDSLCGSPATYPPPGFCANWLPDAGGGG